ncbi:hypothetical protein ABWI01_14310 [Oceanicaulis alexandrii]
MSHQRIADAEPRTFYDRRLVKSAAELIARACSQVFEETLKAED